MGWEKDAVKICQIVTDFPEAETAQPNPPNTRFIVRGKNYGWLLVDHHGDGRNALQLKLHKGKNLALVESDPEKYFWPKYMGHHGYVGIYVDRVPIDWNEVRAFATEAYLLTAPKSLTKLVLQ